MFILNHLAKLVISLKVSQRFSPYEVPFTKIMATGILSTNYDHIEQKN